MITPVSLSIIINFNVSFSATVKTKINDILKTSKNLGWGILVYRIEKSKADTGLAFFSFVDFGDSF